MSNSSIIKKALVTGANGFVGSNLVNRLINEEWEVHIIVRPNSNLRSLDKVSRFLTVHVHDGTTENLLEILRISNPSIVFHLASLFIAQHQSKDIESLIQSNIIFSTQLVEAMVTNGVYNLINTGTSWQHLENKEYSPVCLYAATKQAFEDILTYYTETTPLNTITLKLFDTYGPNDPRPKLLNSLHNIAKKLQPLTMSPGEQLIDIVFIDDVIEAYMIAAGRLLTGKVKEMESYAVSSGNVMTLKELVEVYSQVKGRELPIEWGGRPYRKREVMVPWNSGRILPDWEPKISITEGIKIIEKSRGINDTTIV